MFWIQKRWEQGISTQRLSESVCAPCVPIAPRLRISILLILEVGITPALGVGIVLKLEVVFSLIFGVAIEIEIILGLGV